MGLLQPNQLNPQNSVIDARHENRFSWVTNGAKQTGYRVYIYNNNTDSLLHDSTEIASQNNYYDLPASTLTNGVDCKWYVNSIANSENQDSEYEFFITNATPVVEFSQPDFSSNIEENLNVFDDASDYTPYLSAVADETVTYLPDYGTSSVKMTSGSTGTEVYIYKTVDLDLTQFSNGEASTTDDNIWLICYIPDLGAIDTNGIYLRFGDASDNYHYNWVDTYLFFGWNYLVAPKSSFSSTGSPSWSSINELAVGFTASANDIVYFQTVQMRGISTNENYIIATQSYNFEITYSQDEDTAMKAYKFILSDSNGVEITDTDWIYDFNLKYEFSGFENGETYQIEAQVISQYDQTATTETRAFDIVYQNTNALPSISATANDNNGYIDVDWSNIQYRNATYSATPVYVVGAFDDYGIEIQGGETLDVGSLTITGESEWTVTAWIQLFTEQDGSFINIDDTYYFGYDATSQRFYYYDGGDFRYSETISLSSIINEYIFIGITNEDFIVKKDNTLQASIDLSLYTVPSTIDSFKFVGRIYLDNAHGQIRQLDYATLLEEDSTYLLSATPIVENTVSNGYPITAIQISADRNLIYANNNLVAAGGTLSIYDNDGNSYTSVIVSSSGVSYMRDTSLIELDTNLFAFAFRDAADSQKHKIILFTAADTISIKDIETFYSSTTSQLAITKLSSNFILAASLNSSSGYCILTLISYTDTTLTPNIDDQIVISDYSFSFVDLVTIDSNTAILYLNSGTGIKNVIITKDVDQISIGNIFTLDGYSGLEDFINAFKIDDTHIVYSFRDNGLIYGGITEISGDNLVNNYVKLIYTRNSISEQRDRFFHISGNYYGILINDDIYAGIQLLEVDSNYNIINQDNIQILNNNYDSASVNKSSTSDILISYYNSGTIQVIYSDFNLSTTKSNKEATWTTNYSRFLGNFEQSLQLGNFNTEITTFRLKRLAEDGSLYQTIGDYDSSTLSYLDKTARNSITYTYAIYSLDENGNEDLGTTATSELDFYGWFLTDGSNIYKFDLENDSGSIKSNKDMTVYENYTTYPTIGFGNRNYRQGSLKTRPYSYNSTTLTNDFTLSLLDELRAFINDGETKYLKNTKGEILKIVTSNFDYTYDDVIPSQTYEISFDWIEVGIGEVV